MKCTDFPEDVWPLIAIEYQMLGNYELSCKYLKLTLEENPEDEIAIYNIALCYDLLEKTGLSKDRLVPVWGDLAKNKLGISAKEMAKLKGEIKHFYHLAAIYDLKADAESQEVTNIQGTQSHRWVF